MTPQPTTQPIAKPRNRCKKRFRTKHVGPEETQPHLAGINRPKPSRLWRKNIESRLLFFGSNRRQPAAFTHVLRA